MNKSNRNPICKKTLVRNPVQKLPKVQKPTKKLQYVTVEEPGKPFRLDSASFQSPNKNTVLKLAKQIDSVEKQRTEKATFSVDLPLTERMTKLMNFPANRAVYRDLVPLKSTALHHSAHQPTPRREPLPLKDREPSLSEFYQPLQANESYFTSKVKLDISHRHANSFVDNLKLYKILQANE